MKSKRVLWFISFIISLASMTLSIYVFMSFMQAQAVEDLSDEKTVEPKQQAEENVYYEPQDNIGAVTFTEDQITELSRNIFSYDGFLKDVNVDIDEEQIKVCAKIKDVNKLVSLYPELEMYKSVLRSLENKTVAVETTLANSDGRASINIKSVTVGGVKIDGVLVKPFIEEDEFSELFNVAFDNVELKKDLIVFKNEVPDILKY